MRAGPHVHCRRWPGHAGRSPHYLCDYCPSEAVFHWRTTYPDLMLCAACLALYPEAQGAQETPSHPKTRSDKCSGGYRE